MMGSAEAGGWVVYREDKPFVERALRDGRVEYIDLTAWSFVDRFFAFLDASGFLKFSEQTHPTPRVKQEIPVWFLVACATQLKLHRQSAFLSLDHLLRSGAVLSRLRFNVGQHPQGGFNDKNRKPRETRVDQDAVRKYYKDTPAVRQFRWFNRDVARWLYQQKAFDRSGRFLCDLTLIPVPDNPNYRHVARLPLDEKGNYLDMEKMSAQERKRVRYTPCYALVSLMHVLPRQEGYLYAGAYLLNGQADPVRTMRRLVRNFLKAVGPGVIKLLIIDRGLISGAFITQLKREEGIDVLVPLRSNMEAGKDALQLITHFDLAWKEYRTPQAPEGKILKKEEVAGVAHVRSWEDCQVPLYVAAMRVTQADGTVSHWSLASTRDYQDPAQAFGDYEDRTRIEERHRQLKGCWNLTQFTSPAFNLITTHVFFILRVYTLVQLYLKKGRLTDLTHQMITTLQRQERLGHDAAIVYAGDRFAVFDLDEYTDIILNLEPQPRQRMREWIRLFRQSKLRSPP